MHELPCKAPPVRQTRPLHRPAEGQKGAGGGAAAGISSELFKALREENRDVSIDDAELLQTDYHERQRQFLQEKQLQKVMERVERRIGEILCCSLAFRQPAVALCALPRWGVTHLAQCNH